MVVAVINVPLTAAMVAIGMLGAVTVMSPGTGITAAVAPGTTVVIAGAPALLPEQ